MAGMCGTVFLHKYSLRGIVMVNKPVKEVEPMPEEQPPAYRQARERNLKLEKDKKKKDARKWAKDTAADNIQAP